MEIPYADTATTGHGPTGGNIVTKADNPRKQCAHSIDDATAILYASVGVAQYVVGLAHENPVRRFCYYRAQLDGV